MTEPLVAEDLRKSYGDTTALDGVSLSVGEGEVFGLIGPNGAGKTTLVRSLTGTTEPDSGTVSVFGTDPQSADRQRLGLLPQAFDPPERLTARELVAYYAGLYDEARDPDTVLAEVGLDAADDTWYENLSGGQQRRTCVGTALVNDPDLLFLDEPTTGIDPAGRRALWTLVEDLADRGTTVFLTTHSMEEAERLADRVGLLADGELAAVGPPSDLVAEYGGRTRIVVELDADAESPADSADGRPPSARAADALAAADFEVEAAEGRLVVTGVLPEDIGAVVAALNDGGVAYDSLTWTEPDLEDAFLQLTGESVAAGEGVALGRPADAVRGEDTGDDGETALAGGDR
ncbi:ABC transporter ATP-binding protein [Halorussus gelatinilyticus]|uniref:ABC transporter ATP-binding protein n=1 Tax=Halorussus gelatinilyticus TaxID=2937524 RepID=A0A8U0IFJ3_9EURY|nr:ABC transporter ATP-binding protein [Halorussus gelatinilyticus]UPV99514.1 ABC transporter ATP-binding protein [Halorussus gelatinilyticus]